MIKEEYHICIKTNAMYSKGCIVMVVCYTRPPSRFDSINHERIPNQYHILVDKKDRSTSRTIRPFPSESFIEHFISLSKLRLEKIKQIKEIISLYL